MVYRDRREVLAGAFSLALVGCSGQTAPEAKERLLTSVAISLRVFIPSQAVTYAPLNIPPLRRTFNGGDKAVLQAAIELTTSGNASLRRTFREFGETREYRNEDSRTVNGKPDWFRTLVAGAQMIGSGREQANDSTLNAVWEVPAGGSHGARLTVIGSNPLVTGAPAIDASILVGLRIRAGAIGYMVQGTHDGFPSYELKLNQRAVYSYDPVTSNETPGALFPGHEKTASRAWTPL